jgi:hypothetical protein
VSAVWASEPGNLRAGAAKVEIAPSVEWGLYNSWGAKFTWVHDATFVRAIVVDSGSGNLDLGLGLIMLNDIALASGAHWPAAKGERGRTM